MRLNKESAFRRPLFVGEEICRLPGEIATFGQRGEGMQQPSSAKGAGLRVIAAGRSDIGRVREHNEDTIALCEPENQQWLSRWGRLYVLADGAGGHAAGEVASQTVVETICAVYYQTTASQPVATEAQARIKHLNGPLEDVALPASRVEHAFLMAHTRLQELSVLKPEYSGMATTCLAAIVKDSHILLAHVGDSRAYLIRPHRGSTPTITCLTDDHSMAAEMIRRGIISYEQARQSTSRHTLLRMLGGRTKQAPAPDLMSCLVQPGDSLLLCCDGLWSMVSEAQIAQVVSRNAPQEACDSLIRLANEAGGKDNISAVVLAFV
jgi:protein phosphatase